MKKGLLQYRSIFWLSCCLLLTQLGFTQTINVVDVGQGWSGNSINTVIFRSNAITSYQNYQFTAYYNQEGQVILAKRKLNATNWETHITKYKGNIKDAHNSISIAIDSSGFLHVSWDQHNTGLRYAKSIKPFGLELTEELNMTGFHETSVTYPEFHNLPNGKLLFLYRSGESGNGSTILNMYNPEIKSWKQIQNNLISGENARNAYWQTAIDKNGAIHLSWVWRESWDVATNHDLCYAVSKDGGLTWEKSTGENYQLPITAKTAEVVYQIPQNSNLINQTSMTVDAQGNPYIASYWSFKDAIPQYKVVYQKNKQWHIFDTTFHKTPFSLGGGGTKRIPLSRPKIMVNTDKVYVLFRDEERKNVISMASTSVNNIDWKLQDITTASVGQWEPNYDKRQWQLHNELHIFSQKVVQIDGEGIETIKPQPVQIIEIKDIK